MKKCMILIAMILLVSFTSNIENGPIREVDQSLFDQMKKDTVQPASDEYIRDLKKNEYDDRNWISPAKVNEDEYYDEEVDYVDEDDI